MKAYKYILPAIIALFAQCGQADQTKTNDTPAAPARPKVVSYKPVSTTYYAVTAKDSIKNIAKQYTGTQQAILLAVNRVDAGNIGKLDQVLLPKDMSGDVNQYTPYPAELSFLNEVHKIVFFSYPAQYFAAYEYGQLVHSGPTNMGRQKDQTPTGLFYTNWKAEETKSTFNDEWELKWNFNIENKLGVGWHQYALPGYPASHSCLRLTENDAKYLYEWADQWVIKGTDNIIAKGTPVIVFGSYPFGQSKPWLQLAQNPKALDMSETQLRQEAAQYISDIKVQQVKTDSSRKS